MTALNDKRSNRPALAACIAYLLSCTGDVSAFSAITNQPRAVLKAVHNIPSSEGFSRTRRRSKPMSSRLQYADGAEGHPAAVFRWWNNVFTTKEDGSEDNQQVVDEYLEFLDRRYKRLRSSEGEKPNTFSALSWLAHGSPSKNDIMATAQQKEDSLYVLGVAGLASERLLQKHHLIAQEHNQQRSVTTAQKPPKQSASSSDESVVDVEFSPTQSSLRTLLTREFVVPCIRLVYMAKRRLQFIGDQKRRLTSSMVALLKSVASVIMKGPLTTTKAVLEVGGGKKSIALTFTVATFVLLLLRPILQAALTEGQVGA